MNIFEIYVEKKPKYAQEAASVLADLSSVFGINKIKRVRIIYRYFTEGISTEDFLAAKNTIFFEPPVDIIYETLTNLTGELINAYFFAVELLPGQFDQCADSCAQCFALATGKERPLIHTAKIYAIYGDINNNDISRIKSWIINPVVCRETSLEKPLTLKQNFTTAQDILSVDGFIKLTNEGLEKLRLSMNLAMDLSDMLFCQAYFRDEEKRDPTITEIRVLDTYWSDHCRHTTFLTELDEIQIDNDDIRESYKRYLELRSFLGLEKKPVTLMDMATIAAKVLKKRGLLTDLDESGEINACSVKIKVDVGNIEQDWLLMFKNETHNHPTEIEPFGGASTCLGGAIRDPLSGRAFVYQAMRVTGAANPLQDINDTIPGKLPQIKLCRTAADGYSSYGNQIGVAAGLVNEIYHPGYAAKRMELGAVIAAVPAQNVKRETPTPGDVVILLGGRTGRDGIGGATSSSKSHTKELLDICSAEVQRGNAPEERKILRLFRNPDVTKLIKRCNDFGAGGVSVSVGELADGLLIDLDKVPVKYEGLDGTEIAISESQERMSVVVDKNDAQNFIDLAANENLEATVIAEVTKDLRLVMQWRGKKIVNLSRDFLNTNGAVKHAKAQITVSSEQLAVSRGQGTSNREQLSDSSEQLTVSSEQLAVSSEQLTVSSEKREEKRILTADKLEKFVGGLDICSQKGLIDRFDSSVGAVAAPFGGRNQLTPIQVMVSKIPVLNGDTKTCSLMSWGFDPKISVKSPYHGAIYAVLHSAAKIIAMGGSRKKCWLSFQEYFEKLRDDPIRWGKPASALLGALDAQIGLEIAAIGGKDSMSGSFQLSDGSEINVPPTLVSFAVSISKTDKIITPEFKKADSFVYLLKSPYNINEKPDFNALCEFFDVMETFICQGKILSAWACGCGGTAEAVFKMCLGNRIGFKSESELSSGCGFEGFVVEVNEKENINRKPDASGKPEWEALKDFKNIEYEFLGYTTGEYTLTTPSYEISIDKLQKTWEQTLEPVYPSIIKQEDITEDFIDHSDTDKQVSASAQSKERHIINISAGKNSSEGKCSSLLKNIKPVFLVPVFPGTNGEYESIRAIEKAGGEAQVYVIRNLSPADTTQSIKEFAKKLNNAHVIVIPGGLSCGDEPNGSAKFITAFLRNPFVSDAVMNFLQKRSSLIYGTGNGFQALVKSGLLPFGEIREMTNNFPAFTVNKIGRHQSTFVNIKIVSNISPWLSHLEQGSQYIVPLSTGEGRFIAEEKIIRELATNGQIVTQYVDFYGNAFQEIRFNPCGSAYSIEGLTSADGRIFGQMSHNERIDDGLYKNIPGIRKLDIFTGAIEYFQ